MRRYSYVIATTCRFKYSTLPVLPVLPVPVLYCTGTIPVQYSTRIDQVSHTCRISPVLQYRFHCTAAVVSRCVSVQPKLKRAVWERFVGIVQVGNEDNIVVYLPQEGAKTAYVRDLKVYY